MRERLSGDRDRKLTHVGEVGLSLLAGSVHLGEERLPRRTTLRVPGVQPALQGPQLPGREPPWIALVESRPAPLRLKPRVLLEPGLDLRPDLLVRARPGSPGMRARTAEDIRPERAYSRAVGSLIPARTIARTSGLPS